MYGSRGYSGSSGFSGSSWFSGCSGSSWSSGYSGFTFKASYFLSSFVDIVLFFFFNVKKKLWHIKNVKFQMLNASVLFHVMHVLNGLWNLIILLQYLLTIDYLQKDQISLGNDDQKGGGALQTLRWLLVAGS